MNTWLLEDKVTLYKTIHTATQIESATRNDSAFSEQWNTNAGDEYTVKEKNAPTGNQRKGDTNSETTHNVTDVTQTSTWQPPQHALLQTKYVNHVERLGILQKCAIQVKNRCEGVT